MLNRQLAVLETEASLPNVRRSLLRRVHECTGDGDAWDRAEIRGQRTTGEICGSLLDHLLQSDSG